MILMASMKAKMTLFETNMLHPRKRINLSVREEEFLYLEGLAKVYGFKNVCDIVLAMTRLFMKMATKNRERKSRRKKTPETLTEEIQAMFEEMEQYEPTPQNTAPHQIRRPRKD